MDILIGLALSTHVGLVGAYNEIHPQIRIQQDHFIAGAFYNSEERVSIYAGLQKEWNSGFFIEGGITSGYDAVAPIVPFARAGYKVNDFSNLFVAPGVEIWDGKTNIGIVFGYEVFLNHK